MRLFQILTRRVAGGKIKVTQKLLDRVRREIEGKHESKPAKPRGKRTHGFVRFCLATLVAELILSIRADSARASTGGQPGGGYAAAAGYSVPALFNQANACARDGKPGPAILNYERARLLAPNDADIAANLHFVRVRAGLPDAPENWLSHGLGFARTNTLAWLGSFGLALAGASLLLARLYSRRRAAFRWPAFAGALLAAASVSGAVTVWPRVNEAVVMVREAPARTAPVPGAEPVFKLREGETVTVRAERQSFALVQTQAGRSGWVARSDVARVVPQRGDFTPSTNRN
jgi:hypothetical protein